MHISYMYMTELACVHYIGKTTFNSLWHKDMQNIF